MSGRAIPYLKVIVHVVCLMPFTYLLLLYRMGTLATFSDPVNFITHFTGDWALWLLLTTLAVTPVRRLHPALAWLVRFRRMLGLYCFFYACLHLATYVFLFSGYDMTAAIAGVRAGHLREPFRQLRLIWPSMLDDVQKRQFIQMGIIAWLILLALALTSTQGSIRRMGGYRWNRLHQWIYTAAIAAVVHYWWMVKAGVRTPWKVTVVLAVLLLWRLGISVTKIVSAKQSGRSRRQREGFPAD
jgi:methionine sulfoxide reductase heme-binding subunit